MESVSARARVPKSADLHSILARYVPIDPAFEIEPERMAIIQRAFVHRSVPDHASYERLEWLGDSINTAILTSYIHRRFANESEAFLSRLRSNLISGRVYAEVSRQIGLPGWVRFGDGDEHLRSRECIHEDVYEAFVGALFETFGWNLTASWVISSFEEYIDISTISRSVINPRERLSNFCVSVFHAKPDIQVTEAPGAQRRCLLVHAHAYVRVPRASRSSATRPTLSCRWHVPRQSHAPCDGRSRGGESRHQPGARHLESVRARDPLDHIDASRGFELTRTSFRTMRW